MDKVRFAYLGCTQFSLHILEYIISLGYIPEVIFGIPEEFDISYNPSKVKNTNFADLSVIAKNHDIPFYEVESGKNNLSSYSDILQAMQLDLMLVMGWYYMIPSKIRESMRLGCWGIHASLLPKYAGGAPLTWAIINGEKETGVTLFRMDDGVDDGDIISQKKILIDQADTIKEVYTKATEASKQVLGEVFQDIDNITFSPQDKDEIEVYPQRSPKDGEIDLNLSSEQLYNFIRAQSSPYPGAYIKTSDGKKLIIESARIESL